MQSSGQQGPRGLLPVRRGFLGPDTPTPPLKPHPASTPTPDILPWPTHPGFSRAGCHSPQALSSRSLLSSGPQSLGVPLEEDLGSQEGWVECPVSGLEAGYWIQQAPCGVPLSQECGWCGASWSLEGLGLPVGWALSWPAPPGLTRRADPGMEPPAQGRAGVCWPCPDPSSGVGVGVGKLHSCALSRYHCCRAPLGRWGEGQTLVGPSREADGYSGTWSRLCPASVRGALGG